MKITSRHMTNWRARLGSDEPPLSLADISEAELRHWLENCCAWLDAEQTDEDRVSRQNQIRLLWNELERRGLKG